MSGPPAPERIMVVGSGGAGKSTFAAQLARRSGLPLVHLDALYWRAGWVEPSRQEWADQLGPAIAEPRWVMDGNYGNTAKLRAARAQLVIMLDRPRVLCLTRVVRRAVRFRGRSRPDMAPGCPEHLTWEFVRYVWQYPTQSGPKMRRRLAEAGHDRVVVLRRQRELDAFIDGWPASAHLTP